MSKPTFIYVIEHSPKSTRKWVPDPSWAPFTSARTAASYLRECLENMSKHDPYRIARYQRVGAVK